MTGHIERRAAPPDAAPDIGSDIDPDIAVVIAARDAAETIGAAIVSALAQPRVAEVMVIDDASRDATAAAVREAAGRDADPGGRLCMEVLERNGGPAAARNRAVAATRAPLVAILDADDRFAPDRFRHMPREGFDLWADDVAFFTDRDAQARLAAPAPTALRRLDLEAFVAGNVARPARPRGELGFLKPVMARRFLQRHGLRYDESLRLGEDYALYARALALGARFVLAPAPGYAALLRSDSLSVAHRTADLAALGRADEQLLAEFDLAPRERRALLRHRASVRTRHDHRECLDIRREHGRWSALRHAAARPDRLRAVVAGVLRDKLSGPPPVPATLLAGTNFAGGDANASPPLPRASGPRSGVGGARIPVAGDAA